MSDQLYDVSSTGIAFVEPFQGRKFPPSVAGLEDLPLEIFEMIIEACVVDDCPIVDPVGACMRGTAFGDCHLSQSSPCGIESVDDLIIGPEQKKPEYQLPLHRCELRPGELGVGAEHYVRELIGAQATGRNVRPSTIRPALLRTNRNINRISKKFLYEKNVFLFTSPFNMACFSAKFRRHLSDVRHVTLVFHWRYGIPPHLLDFVEHSRGTLKSGRCSGTCHITQSPSWFASPSLDLDRLFPNLETLNINLSNWRQLRSTGVKWPNDPEEEVLSTDLTWRQGSKSLDVKWPVDIEEIEDEMQSIYSRWWKNLKSIGARWPSDLAKRPEFIDSKWVNVNVFVQEMQRPGIPPGELATMSSCVRALMFRGAVSADKVVLSGCEKNPVFDLIQREFEIYNKMRQNVQFLRVKFGCRF